MNTTEFIEKNNLRLRPQQELLTEFQALNAEKDFLGFKKEVLLDYLTLENARPFLDKDYMALVDSGKETWEIMTIEKCVEEFRDYMKFAFGKALDQRGISASRSIEKLGMWLWIMGRDDLYEKLNDDDLYNPYGAPALIEVCDAMGIDVPKALREFAKVKC